ncbi:hypothetical protein B0H19DRAFT_1261137 [Mycena capillaripes]|nr:hypothetical protein B0H19DRAFT_1261137 [Mycena capillaripes]
MRFISYISVSAALLWAAYANPLSQEPTSDDLFQPGGPKHVRSLDIITEVDLIAAREQLQDEAEDIEARSNLSI